MSAGLIRIAIAAVAFALGWFLDRRLKWSPTLQTCGGFWILQVVAIGTACNVFPLTNLSYDNIWFIQPVAAFVAGILFAEIKTFWRWLAVASTVLIALLQRVYV